MDEGPARLWPIGGVRRAGRRISWVRERGGPAVVCVCGWMGVIGTYVLCYTQDLPSISDVRMWLAVCVGASLQS